ncbi:MAG: hypothetical protein ACTSQ8_07915 [Candidatus Helarchaeota archaeon]
MTTASPFTRLREIVNPMISEFTPDERPSTDPLLSILGQEQVVGIQTSTSGMIDLFAFKSQPAIIVGDRRAYKPGTKDMGSGRIKMKFFTEQIVITEDEYLRMVELGDASIIARNVKEQRIRNNRYLINQLQRWAVNRWKGAKTDADYDKDWVSLFHPSDAGTITDPSDLNSTAGTPLDLTSLSFQGGQQTTNNLTQVLGEVFKLFKKVDYLTKDVFPWTKMYMGCHPLMAAILKGTTEILNSTTGQRSTESYYQLLTNQGITVVESVWFDDDFAAAEDGSTELVFFTDPELNFKMIVNVPPEGADIWSPWKDGKQYDEKKGVNTVFYETHKSMEIGFYSTPYYIYTAAATASFFKAMCTIQVTGYNNSA